MPFASLCRKCGFFMIGENKEDATMKIRKHFKESHNSFPRPDPVYLDISDFEPNPVDLTDESGASYEFPSRLFCSEDYCLTEIAEKDYERCVIDSGSQEFLSTYLQYYLPRA